MPAGMSLVQLHPLAENSLHLDLCTYVHTLRWIYGMQCDLTLQKTERNEATDGHG